MQLNELPLRVQARRGSLPGQLVEQVRQLVAEGVLQPGDRLPSTRNVAQTLGVSRGTVTAAWDQLTAEGFLVATRGGTRITPTLPPLPRPAVTTSDGASTTHHQDAALLALMPGRADTSLLTDHAWRRAWRQAAAAAPVASLPGGTPRLRHELAEHLRLTRAVVRPAGQVLVTGGARDGLRLLLTTLQASLGRMLVVAVEDPGYPSLHRVPQALGHRVVPTALDEHGLNPRLLGDDVDVVLVAPSHQYPLGASMPVARRAELLEWARDHDAIVVEDDYDSELRWVGEPLPALAALDDLDGCVVTLGSFTKTVALGLGLGRLVVPARLAAPVVETARATDSSVSVTMQDAMSCFLAEGGLRRHTARLRRRYRRRRDLTHEVLARHLPDGVSATAMDGGLHTVIGLPSAAHERATVRLCREHGVLVAGLGEYWSARRTPGRAGLVVGFGGVPTTLLGPALEVVASAVAASVPPDSESGRF